MNFFFAIMGADIVISRALQFVAGTSGYALLTTPAAALSTTNWSISYRIRPDALPGPCYVTTRATGNLDKAALIYHFVANTFEFFDNNNSTGGVVRLALATATPPNDTYYEIQFTYDGTTLRAFLNGTLSSSLAAVFTLNTSIADLIIGQRNASGGNCSVTLDYIRETENGAATVTLELNEVAPGPYVNTGPVGGSLTISAPAPNSILV